MTKLMDLTIPDIGSSQDVNVAEVYVKSGDNVKEGDTLLMLETDKATMEVPAAYSGVIQELTVSVNTKVNSGDVIGKISLENEANTNNQPSINEQAISNKPSTKEEAKPSSSDSPNKPAASNNVQANTTNIDEEGFKKAYASPSIRKLAREMGVDLSKIKGSGAKGRITEVDVREFNKVPTNGSRATGLGFELLPWPEVDFNKFGQTETKDLSRIKKLSGANLSRNWVMIPHVTQFDEADITELEEFRTQLNNEYKKQEIKVTPLAFLIKAVVVALKKFPEFNSSLTQDKLVYKYYYNIGFAADTPQGLVVPVLKDADKKGIVEIALETAKLASLARDGKLSASDMQGGTFTISSLGGIGGTSFTPIINAPEVAILGISKSSIKPVWDNNAFIPRLMLPLSLSYDHRVIDGALAARFTTFLAKVISDIRRLTL